MGLRFGKLGLGIRRQKAKCQDPYSGALSTFSSTLRCAKAALHHKLSCKAQPPEPVLRGGGGSGGGSGTATRRRIRNFVKGERRRHAKIVGDDDDGGGGSGGGGALADERLRLLAGAGLDFRPSATNKGEEW